MTLQNSKTIEWLLEDDSPAIKYRTLTEIEDITDEIDELYNSIWHQKTIERMILKQDENGLWDKKKFGGHTALRYLTALCEHGLRKDARIDAFVSYSINWLKTKESEGSGCSNALVLRALVMLGYHKNEEVLGLINRYYSQQLYDGGFMCRRLLDRKPDRKSCYKANLASLLLAAECKRKKVHMDGTDKLIEYFIKRNVFYKSDLSELIIQARSGWGNIDNFFPVEPMRIGLPMIMSALSILGVGNHPSLQYGWEFLSQKENSNGRYMLEGTLTKQPCSFGKVGTENKWITFYSLLAQKYRKMYK